MICCYYYSGFLYQKPENHKKKKIYKQQLILFILGGSFQSTVRPRSSMNFPSVWQCAHILACSVFSVFRRTPRWIQYCLCWENQCTGFVHGVVHEVSVDYSFMAVRKGCTKRVYVEKCGWDCHGRISRLGCYSFLLHVSVFWKNVVFDFFLFLS